MCLQKILSLKFWRSRQPNTEPLEKKVDRIHDNTTVIVRFMIKEPEQYDSLKQCIVTWNKKTSTFYLYQNLKPSLASAEKGKFLLAARIFKYPSHIEYVISLDADDISKESYSYVGKLSSDYLGVNFTIYENGPLLDEAFATKQINPNNFKIGQIYYRYNELESKGPRSFVCSIKCLLRVDSSKNKAFRNEDFQCFCLEYNGKEYPEKELRSVVAGENMKLTSNSAEDDTFTMAYRHPFSEIQAFAISSYLAINFL